MKAQVFTADLLIALALGALALGLALQFDLLAHERSFSISRASVLHLRLRSSLNALPLVSPCLDPDTGFPVYGCISGPVSGEDLGLRRCDSDLVSCDENVGEEALYVEFPLCVDFNCDNHYLGVSP